MNFEEYLIAIQLLSDEGPGRKARAAESIEDEQDRVSREALGVMDG